MIDKTIFDKYFKWKNACGEPQTITPADYVSFNIHPEDALLLFEVFSGEFVEHDGYIFRQSLGSDTPNKVNLWLDKGLSYTETQKVLNHVHVYDLFANCTDQVGEQVFVELAKKVCELWQFKLAKQYPDIEFIVKCSNTDADYGPTVVFYQE